VDGALFVQKKLWFGVIVRVSIGLVFNCRSGASATSFKHLVGFICFERL